MNKVDSINLNQLRDVSLSTREIAPKKATREQIESAVKRQDFFGLSQLCDETITFESKTGEYDYKTREVFFRAFSELNRDFGNLLKKKELNQIQGYEQLSDNQKAQLERFATEGTGGESIRIFAKVPLPLMLDDQKYPTKIMSYAKNTHRAVQDGKEVDVKIEEKLLLDERYQHQQRVSDFAVGQLKKLADPLKNMLGNLQIEVPEGVNTHTFIRGMLGSGKSYFLESSGIKEEELGSPDALKPLLGKAFEPEKSLKDSTSLGDRLVHHEGAALNGKMLVDPSLEHKADMRTLNKFNVQEILKTKEKVQHIVLELNVSFDTAKNRVEHRVAHENARPIKEEILKDSFEGMQKNRVLIIESASKDEKIEWYFYDNNGQKPVLVASIKNKALKVFNEETFSKLRKEDAMLDKAIIPLIA